MLNVSIIVVNYRSADLVRKLVESVKNIDLHSDTEWIIVNNSPEDNKLKNILITNSKKRLIVILETEKNIGFGAGCNLGSAKSTADILLFLNPDCEFVGGSFADILRRFEEDPGVGAIGPILEDRGGRIEFSWHKFPSIRSEASLKVKKTCVDYLPIARRFSRLDCGTSGLPPPDASVKAARTTFYGSQCARSSRTVVGVRPRSGCVVRKVAASISPLGEAASPGGFSGTRSGRRRPGDTRRPVRLPAE